MLREETLRVQTGSRIQSGAAFALDTPADVEPVWGSGDQVAWARGETTLLVGPQGVGKTTLAQQLLLASIGLRQEVLGMPVAEVDRVLYIAADRPRQAQRSVARMVSEEDRDVLETRLVVNAGPLAFSIAEQPTALASFANDLGCGRVLIDSCKDVAVDLAKDETGSRVNLAFQECLAADIDLLVLHHQRKAQAANTKPKTLEDVYGSVWITSGAGSVLLLWGQPGDLLVELSHLKQPIEPIGPLTLVHDHARGTTTQHETVDLEDLLWRAGGAGITAPDAAGLINATDTPTRNDIERARRKLDRLCDKGKAHRTEAAPPVPTRYYSTKTGATHA